MAAEAEEVASAGSGDVILPGGATKGGSARLRAALLVAGVALVIRLLAWTTLYPSSIFSLHTIPTTDMAFFDRWARAVSNGDLLSLNAFPDPRASMWDLAAAQLWYERHNPGAPFSVDAAHAVWRTWLHNGFFQDPGYAYAVGLVYAAGGSVSAVFLLQSLAGIGVALLVWWITLLMTGPRAAVFAGILSAAFAPQILFEFLLLRDFAVVVTSMLSIALLVAGWRSHRGLPWFLFGLVSGAGVLLKSSMLLLFAMDLALVLFLAFRARRNEGARTMRTTALALTLSVAGFAVALSPLVARNVAAGAPPFRLAGLGAKAFIADNARDYDPSFGPFESRYTQKIVADNDAALIGSAVDAIRTHDSVFSWLWLCVRKLAWFFRWFEMPNNESFYLFAKMTPVGYSVRFSAIAALALVGVFVTRNRGAVRPALLVYVASGLVTTFLFTNLSRYRLQYAVGLIPFAGAAVDWLVAKVSLRDWSRLVPAAAVMALALLFILRPLPPDIPFIRMPAYIRSNLAAETLSRSLVDQGSVGMALRVMRRELKTEPSMRQLESRDWPYAAAPLSQRIEIAASYSRLHRLTALLERATGNEGESQRHTSAADALAAVARTSAQ